MDLVGKAASAYWIDAEAGYGNVVAVSWIYAVGVWYARCTRCGESEYVLDSFLLFSFNGRRTLPLSYGFVDGDKIVASPFSSLLMGVWLMSTAAADKCCGMLSALYPTDHSVGVFSFLHFSISSKADFFMMLAIMTFVAALILFLVSKKLNNMMKME